MKRFAWKVSQEEIDALAHSLYREQDTINRYNTDRPTPDAPSRLLTSLRRQCCDKGGAFDPFPDMPHVPGIFDGNGKKRGRG